MAAPLLYEELIPFDCEVSIIGARSPRGEVVIYPLNGNVHSEGILRLTRAPYGPPRWQKLAAGYRIETHTDTHAIIVEGGRFRSPLRRGNRTRRHVVEVDEHGVVTMSPAEPLRH